MCAAYTGTFSTYAAACTVLTLPSLADTSVPTIICPGAISAELGTSNAITASAMDASSTEVSCTPANTMDLPAGRHASVCTARDDVNLVATCNVDVTVTGALRSSNTGHVHPYPIAWFALDKAPETFPACAWVNFERLTARLLSLGTIALARLS